MLESSGREVWKNQTTYAQVRFFRVPSQGWLAFNCGTSSTFCRQYAKGDAQTEQIADRIWLKKINARHRPRERDSRRKHNIDEGRRGNPSFKLT